MPAPLSKWIAFALLASTAALPARAMGGFGATDIPGGLFAEWAATAGAQKLVGDFNHDGNADIALIGPAAWHSVPVAFSNGDGTFRVTSASSSFPSFSGSGNPKTLIGDFNHDGKGDLTLTGAADWGSVPVALSNGDGTFNVTNAPINGFATWAAETGVKIFVGGDGKTDLGLTGVDGWHSVPLAFSNGDGTFDVTDQEVIYFPINAMRPGVTITAGDFNADSKTDVAATGASWWTSVPVIFPRRRHLLLCQPADPRPRPQGGLVPPRPATTTATAGWIWR